MAEARRAGVRDALRDAWRRSGGWSGLVAGTAPTAAFVGVSAVAGLAWAVVAAIGVAVAASAWQRVRGESLRSAVAGVVLAAACALAAVVTGETRGFFLLSTAFPVVLVLACAGTLVARRPLTGLVVNPVAGGPAAWRRDPRLVRIYTVTTVITLAVSVVNAVLRLSLYAADRTAALAVVYAASGPVFVVLGASTLVAVRRHLARAGTA